MYVIAGATGHTGSVAAETLLAQGKPVRALVRDEARGAALRERGAELAVVDDLRDEDALARALAGASGAYLLIPPTPTSPTVLAHQAAVADAIARAVDKSGIPHVVFLSSQGAQHATGVGPVRALHHAEQRLRGLRAAVTVLRPGYFMENWAGPVAAAPSGKLPTFFREGARLVMVATRDIGEAAARALLEGGEGFRIIELAGPRDYTAADVAEAVSGLVGKPVRPEYLPEEAIVPTFTGFGLSKDYATLFAEMYPALSSGRMDPEGEVVRGKVPIEDVLRPLVPRQ